MLLPFEVYRLFLNGSLRDAFFPQILLRSMKLLTATWINGNDGGNVRYARLHPAPALQPEPTLTDRGHVTDAWPLQSATTPKQTWIPYITNFTVQSLHSKDFHLSFLPGHDKKAQWSKEMRYAGPCPAFVERALSCQQAKDDLVEFSVYPRLALRSCPTCLSACRLNAEKQHWMQACRVSVWMEGPEI